jgi:RNA polymerase sigma-70 factor (ECF subfamily)
MSDSTWDLLRGLLVDRYDKLKSRLARRLGSAELAGESLQATYLRLERAGAIEPPANPEAYLLRIALNVAADQRHAQRRQLGLAEIEALRHQDDDELDPGRIAEARLEIDALARALDELPVRRREIFMAARLHELPHAKIATRHGISIRMVERELRCALQHCRDRLGRKPEKN